MDSISNGKNYHIAKNETVVEQGQLILDTKHQKMTFESDQSTWKAWFYGYEFRLSNKKIGLKYSLRKSKKDLTTY